MISTELFKEMVKGYEEQNEVSKLSFYNYVNTFYVIPNKIQVEDMNIYITAYALNR